MAYLTSEYALNVHECAKFESGTDTRVFILNRWRASDAVQLLIHQPTSLRTLVMDLFKFAEWAHTDGYTDKTTAMLQALYRCKDMPNKETYLQATADALGIEWTVTTKVTRKRKNDEREATQSGQEEPVKRDDESVKSGDEAMKSGEEVMKSDEEPMNDDEDREPKSNERKSKRSKKRLVIEDEESDDEEVVSSATLDIGASYKVETLREDGRVEDGYFRKDQIGITWYYTANQIAEIFEDPPKHGPNALWISSHKEADFETGCPFEKISIDKNGYEIVGVFKAQEPMSLRMVTDYVDILCARGNYPSSRLVKYLKTLQKWDVVPIQKGPGTCSACGRIRTLTHRVNDPSGSYMEFGTYCYERVQLAHRFLHMTDHIDTLTTAFFSLIK